MSLEHEPSVFAVRPPLRFMASAQSVSFFVPGVPATAGSKRAFLSKRGKIIVTEDCKTAKPWRQLVQAWALEAMAGRPLLAGPLRLDVEFGFARPKGHFGAKGLRRSAPKHCITRPDATKLVRALEDALTGIVWHDDAQVVLQTVRKDYGPPGAIVTVEAIGD